MVCRRLHKSSLVVALLLATVAVSVELPGRVVRGTLGTDQTTEFEHGWPWVYLRRDTFRQFAQSEVPPERQAKAIADFVSIDLSIRTDLPRWSIPWLTAANWRFWEADRREQRPHRTFVAWLLIVDLFTALFGIAVVVVVWEWRRRRRPSAWGARLAELFIAITAICVVMGWRFYLDREYRREKQVADAASDRLEWFADSEVCLAPLWIQSLIGPRLLPSYVWRYSRVSLHVDERLDAKSQLAAIAQLHYVREIDVEAVDGERYPFSVLRNVNYLDTLDISGYPKLDQSDVDELTQLTSLQELVLGDNDNAREIVSRLATEMPKCKVTEGYGDW